MVELFVEVLVLVVVDSSYFLLVVVFSFLSSLAKPEAVEVRILQNKPELYGFSADF